MKINDRYKIALHNISNNKSRSILTTIIVFLMSFVIMSLLFISISFSKNMTKISNKYVKDTVEYVTTEYLYIQNNGQNKGVTKTSYASLDKCLEKNKNLVDMVKFSSQQNKVFLTNYRFTLDQIVEIKDGAFPTSENVNTNYVLVSQDYVSKYLQTNGTALNVGDTFVYQYSYYSLNNNETTSKDLSLKVGGIFTPIDKTFATSSSSKERIISDDEVILDTGYLLNNFDSVMLTEGRFYSSTTKDNISITKLLNDEKKLVKELNSILPKYTLNGKQESSIYCITLNELKMYSTVNKIVIGVASFMGVILVVLSIGSLSNTIMISVNKNKKFIGLLKAMGIKQKDLESIIRLESFTLITVGIILSFICVLALNNVFVLINQKILSGTVSYLLNAIEYKVTFSAPLYVPVIVLGFFLFLTFLFSRTSISEIADEDPINVISEVA